MTDVAFRHTENGGEISIVAGQVAMDDGLYSSVYISMWGGNENDSGLPVDNRFEWWGNRIETEKARVIRSQTQNALRSLPATPGNLIRIEDAVSADLEWMTTELGALIDATVTMPARNSVHLVISISIDGNQKDFSFAAPWGTNT
jgi:hypothetical protein